MLLLALAMLVLDAGLLLSRLLRWPRAASALRGPKLRPMAGVLALLVSGYGISQGMAVPQTRQIEVAINDLPPRFDGYRVLQLTDIHANASKRKTFTQTFDLQMKTLDTKLSECK